jgi:hypothetical protein
MLARSLLVAVTLALSSGALTASAAGRLARPASDVHPAISLASVSVSKGPCVTARVLVSAPPTWFTSSPRRLTGTRHIHFELNRYYVSASKLLTQRWCGATGGVKHGTNTVRVYLAKSNDQIYPSTKAITATISVK